MERAITKRAITVCIAMLFCCLPLFCCSARNEENGRENGGSEYMFEITQDKSVLKKGGTATVTVSELSKDGEPQEKTIVWHSSDEAVAVVTGGTVIAVAAGTAEIYAEFTENGDAVRSNSVTIDVYETAQTIDITDPRQVNYYGRNVFGESAVTLQNTASAFEVRFIGESLKAQLAASGPGVRLRLYVNGEAAEQMLDVGTAAAEYTLADGCDAGKLNVIKAVKVNSADKGTVVLGGLSTDGEFATPPAKPALKLEFYGDSITCGYGINNLDADNAANEDGTATYAYLTAEQLGAQLYIQSYSGISLGLPMTTWGFGERQYMAAMYDWISPKVLSDKWNAEEYQADIIVVALGTNDAAAVSSGLGSPSTLTDRAAQFIKTLRAGNATAEIVLCYGMMGVNAQVDAALRSAVRESGESGVHYLTMKQVSCTAFNGHPDKAGQADGARQLTDFIEEKLGV